MLENSSKLTTERRKPLIKRLSAHTHAHIRNLFFVVVTTIMNIVCEPGIVEYNDWIIGILESIENTVPADWCTNRRHSIDQLLFWFKHRCNFKAYCLFSFFNTVVYCIPGTFQLIIFVSPRRRIEVMFFFQFLAGWVWGEHGFLNKLGAVDIAGSGPVSYIWILKNGFETSF